MAFPCIPSKSKFTMRCGAVALLFGTVSSPSVATVGQTNMVSGLLLRSLVNVKLELPKEPAFTNALLDEGCSQVKEAIWHTRAGDAQDAGKWKSWSEYKKWFKDTHSAPGVVFKFSEEEIDENHANHILLSDISKLIGDEILVTGDDACFVY